LAPKEDEVGVNNIKCISTPIAPSPDLLFDQFKNAIGNGALLGIVTDAYHGQP
jgi:hypothetical protein